MLTWMAEHDQVFSGIKGSVSEVFNLGSDIKLPYGMERPQLERLIESLLGADVFGIVVNDSQAAAAIMVELSKTEGGKGVLSVISQKGTRSNAGATASQIRLFDLLEYSDENSRLVEALLGDIYLVETLDDALKCHDEDRYGLRFVSIDGVVIWPNGKMTIGAQSADIDGVLTRKRRNAELADELEHALSLLEELEMDLSTAEQNLSVAQNDGLEISQTLARLQGDYEAAVGDQSRLETAMTQTLQRHREVEQKISDVDRKRNMTAPLAGEYEERISQLEAELADLETRIEEASEVLYKATEEKNSLGAQLSECKVRLEGSKSTMEFNRTRLDTLEKEIKDLERTLEVSRQTESSLNIIRLRIDPLYSIYEELHEHASIWAQKLRDQAQLEQTDSTNLRTVISDATAAVNQAREELDAVKSRLTDVRIEQSKLETEVRHAMQRIAAENDTPLEAALETPPPEDRHACEERANRLRKKIASLGAVNHVAMQEYEELKKRRDYMLSQIEDLQEARKALARITAALDKKMRNQFLETFEQVNKNYQEVFQVLFPGGNGQLLLIEGESAENNGIEVSAQPRGKKISKLSLMSGGEKSLAALALLFAVYKIRSVPFYILDEVEAALDDTNLRRLLDYLTSMRNKTQLILVSHQRRTMEAADVLYGVSMQAAGVSKLVSQRLDEALRHASAEVAQEV
jgi:chromosome segregation protein